MNRQASPEFHLQTLLALLLICCENDVKYCGFGNSSDSSVQVVSQLMLLMQVVLTSAVEIQIRKFLVRRKAFRILGSLENTNVVVCGQS